jgi:hypothetical protein
LVVVELEAMIAYQIQVILIQPHLQELVTPGVEVGVEMVLIMPQVQVVLAL